MNISVTSGGTFGEKVKEFLRKDGTKAIQNSLGEYIKALREEYATDLILPTSQKGAPVSKTKTIINSKPTVSNLYIKFRG